MSKLDEDKVWATDLVRLIVNAEREGGGFRIYHDQAISEIVARLREARGVTGGATVSLSKPDRGLIGTMAATILGQRPGISDPDAYPGDNAQERSAVAVIGVQAACKEAVGLARIILGEVDRG